MYRFFFKRVIDFIIALTLLIAVSPIIFIVTILLVFVNGGKAFYFQSRPGKNEKIFRVYKFKTMNDKCDARGNLLSDSERLTRIGSIVRATSIDELPQLINVLLGDMSLIGPRPLLLRYLPYYTGRERIRHNVLPGVTGWAQINGRNNVNWESRLEMDVWYVENLSLKLDIKIYFMTFLKVIRPKNVTVNAGDLNFRDFDVERSENSVT